ncbi:unnamed protein product [Trifolium pratense]|uniref:Uncharacterized protein n=1 Tax=Trifolium pratense TaxID=57577 RepID=A0ACB0JXE8_TRIPR|nr:unnamed protein product [Trifolium pratense]
MDSNTILDYALFQLTPTRTRFELLVFNGTGREKIASGLFEPFISHLKFVKDEISKGGYSIRLLPPSNTAYWFSKLTFERFVRFVSTPAVLERFVSLEKEIQQIDSQFQANALSMSVTIPDEGNLPQTNGNTRRLSDSTKLNDVLEGVDIKEEENSKISLQRLLESRIALLRKEQAMAYTRSLVAGFDIDNIDDLVYFANAFGASRLREACINFKDLWKKKHADDLWVQEVAAMQSSLPPAFSFSGSSGIILANDIPSHEQNNKNNSSTDSIPSGDENAFLETSSKKEDVNLSHTANVHMPMHMPWPYNVPPYMYNPGQQMAYQGYPPYHQNNMHWSSNMGVNQKSSATKKEKSHYKKRSEEYEEQLTESSDPDSGSESDSDKQKDSNNSLKEEKRKKHRRKSTGTVVIRNINYITPKRRNGNESGNSDESSLEDDAVFDEETIKQKVGVALESLQKVHKAEKRGNRKKSAAKHNATKSSDAADEDESEDGNKNENWNAFQSLLKIDTAETGIDGSEQMQSIDVQDEHFVLRNSEGRSSSPKNREVVNDSFIVTDRDRGNEGGSKLNEYVDNYGPITKIKENIGEDILLSHISRGPRNELDDPLNTSAADSLQTKGRGSEDWFIVDNNLENTRSHDSSIVPIVFDSSNAEKRSDRPIIDDSFMIQGQLVDNNLSDSQWKTDMSMVEDLTSSNKLESDTKEKNAAPKIEEPNDLCMVLRRDSGSDSVEASRTMDYEIDFSYSEPDRRTSVDDSQVTVNNNLPSSPKKTNVVKSKVSRLSGKGTPPDMISRNKKPSLPKRPIVQKSQREKEDEIRRQLEEKAIERQKRIAERTASSGVAARISPKTDKNKTQTVTRVSSVKVRGN